MTPPFSIQRATSADLPATAALAGQLVRLHHETDPRRFLLVDDVERGYEAWLRRELTRREAVILVAKEASQVVGYAYGALESRDWMVLLDEHGAFHDLFVEPSARRSGLGRALVLAMISELQALGAPRIVLSTLVHNQPAQALFASCGFRATLLEMTRDAGPASSA